MATGKLRPRIDGGCSLCKASDENVGKRRCCHMLGGVTMDVVHKKGTNFVNISGTLDNNEKVNVSTEADEAKITEFVMHLSDGLSTSKKNGILKALREQDL